MTHRPWLNPHTVTEAIARLDARADHQTIVRLLFCHEFPWDSLSVEFAFFRTFAVPEIAALLDATGEFARRPQKRYDDTDLLLSEIVENGYDSARGLAAIRRMNQIHHRFNISNENYLYVLSTFIFEPVRWIARYGWRNLTQKEKTANFYFWLEVGRRMGIRNIPPEYAAFEAFNLDYERNHFRYTPSNQRVAEATRDLFLGWFLPQWAFPLGRPLIHAVMDEALREAVGLPAPPPLTPHLVKWGLQARGQLLHRLPLTRFPSLRTHQKRPSYPQGYTIEEIGP